MKIQMNSLVLKINFIEQDNVTAVSIFTVDF